MDGMLPPVDVSEDFGIFQVDPARENPQGNPVEHAMRPEKD
jgi:hypothetical protein